MERWEKDFMLEPFVFADGCTDGQTEDVLAFFRPLIPRWVRVEDGLPRETRVYIIADKSGGEFTSFFSASDKSFDAPYVAYWLDVKIPPIPEEGK